MELRLKEQLDSWLYEIGEKKAASFLKQCDIAVVPDDYWGDEKYHIEISLLPITQVSEFKFIKSC